MGRTDRRKYRETMLEIAGDIVAGRLPPGAVLPRELALAERYDISRGGVRECMRALEERGLITVKHGSVTTVNPREAWDLFDVDVLAVALAGPEADRLLGEYLECRRIIEIEAAGLAAERATRERIGALEDRFEAMVAALSLRPAREQERAYHEADVAFHIALVEATGNGTLAALVRRIDDALLAARYPLARPAYRRTRAIPEHEAILVAVRARDGAGARAAMHAHLATIEGYLREHARKVARDARGVTRRRRTA